MWSQLLLCVLGFSFVFANCNNPAWKENTEYIYKISGRTVAGLNEVSNHYTGVLLKARLALYPKCNGNIHAKISDVLYGQLQTELPNGWNTEIPESEVSYKPLPMSNQPFQIVMRNGVVKDLIVSKDVTNWEANIIKSIVSQFQLDTKAENVMRSHNNILPEENSNNAVYKTMEDTVNGKAETQYDIHPLPKYIIQSKPWLVPQKQLIGDEQVIEIVKNKNFTNSQKRPSYHFGLGGMPDYEPSTNQMGEFFTRTSVSRAIITGNLNRYIVQNSYTINKIVVSPTLSNVQKGSVVSMLNVTLFEVSPTSQQPQPLSNPVKLGDLVYRFNQPYSGNQVRSENQNQRQSFDQEESNEETYVAHPRLFRRSISQELRSSQLLDNENNNEQYWAQQEQQEEPKMDKAPHSPFLPQTVGYKGQSIKQGESYNVPEKVIKMAQQMGEYVQHAETIVDKHVLSRFIILVQHIRLMDFSELEQVSQKLYIQASLNSKYATWLVLRDAVAQAGTLPAYLMIEQWVHSKKITGPEAAEVLSTISLQVHEPTLEFVRKFFELVKSPQVQSEHALRESALLSLGRLLNRVYVEKRESHNNFPVHVYGRFRTPAGRKFMRQTVIPYLANLLEQGVQQDKVNQIFISTRTLGNIGDKEILHVFEPYLEGKKQVSQFQRLFIVVAMDKLTQAYPEIARNVLYRIYQNSGEHQEVRVAAVYQLMKTNPPTEMLQRMAQYTNVDVHDNVNAAVKSVIEDAAQTVGERFKNLRTSARAAKPLLAKRTYGWRQSQSYLKDHVVDELKLRYYEVMNTIESEGSYIPKSVRLDVQTTISELRRHMFHSQSMVSGIDQLITVLEKQTESYALHKQAAQNAHSNKWSSQHIAQLLKLKVEEKEQLEGLLHVELGNFQQLFTYSNQTIEKIPQIMQVWEQILKQGTQVNYLKFLDVEELVVAFPTEMGLPFVYTYYKPGLIRIQGKLEIAAEPQISRGGKLHKPQSLSIKNDLTHSYETKEQGHITFLTPFDHQQYVAGYEKTFLYNIPIRAYGKVNLEEKKVKLDLEPLARLGKQTLLVHLHSTPFISKTDLLNAEPIFDRPTTQVIEQKLQQGFDEIVGQKETGMAFRIQYQHEQQRNNLMWLQQFLNQRDPIYAVMRLFSTETIERRQLSVNYMPEPSVNRKIQIKLGYQQEYRSEAQDVSNESQSPQWKDLLQIPTDENERQQQFIKKAGAGINNVNIKVLDAHVEFQGKKPIHYTLTGSYAKSNVDSKSNVLFRYKKHTVSSEYKPFELVLIAKSKIPNTNGLDLTDSLKNEPQIDTEVKVAFGENLQQTPTEIEAQIALRRSESRKQYLMELPLYQQCKREMQDENNQLPACANLTIRANLLDNVQVKVQHQNLKPELSRKVQGIYDSLRYGFNFLPFVNIEQGQQSQGNQVNVQARFAPNLQTVNVTVQAGQEQTTFHNIWLHPWAQTVAVAHPVFHLPSRVFGKVLGYQNFRPTCVMDQNKGNTFSNKTYPIESLGYDWTVMMQYVPQRARENTQQPQITGEELLKQELQNYLVLVRSNKRNPKQKDIKITFNDQRTNGQVIEITLTPVQTGPSVGSDPRGKVFVGEQEIKISQRSSHDIQKDLVQIYALANGEVKVEVRDNFYVIYDGERAKLTLRNGKFHEQIRGLCGQNKHEPSTDFLTPANCIVNNPREFIQSYNVEKPNQQQEPKYCVKPEVSYVNVISKHHRGGDNNNGLKFRTRYIIDQGEICFTIRSLPVCSGSPNGTIRKNVEVHCVQKTTVTDLWTNQIEEGKHLDFSQKPVSRKVQMDLPERCSA